MRRRGFESHPVPLKKRQASANIPTTDCVHHVEDKKSRRSSGGNATPMNGMLRQLNLA